MFHGLLYIELNNRKYSKYKMLIMRNSVTKQFIPRNIEEFTLKVIKTIGFIKVIINNPEQYL